MRGIFFLPVITLAMGAFADAGSYVQAARDKKLASSPEWRKLLHMRRTWFGHWKSDVDGPHFFIAENGRRDAQAELDATIASFFEPPVLSTDVQHPQCRYPARFSWLDQRLGFGSDVPRRSCERFDSWREKIDPVSVSIVFSGYYLNNPASMYGHTFLRVGRRSDGDSPKPLLEYTVNFAAQTNTRSGLAFAVLGLAGGYPGTFTAVPYYMKVQQYNNLESRDLWEYKLNLTQGEVEQLIRHVWELGPTSISYYFFNKNCSYQLLPLLEVARPALSLSQQFQVRAIPLDTLKAVIVEPGLVSGRDLRPSALRTMRAERDALSESERDCALDPAPCIDTIPGERKSLVMSAAYDYWRYRHGYAREQPAEVREAEHTLLAIMSKLPPSKNAGVRIDEPFPPEAAHPTGRIGFGFGATRDNGFEEISIRGALHDLEADPAGLVDGSQLEMMGVRLRYDNAGSDLYVDEATGIHVWSLSPWEEWIHKPSWRVHIRYARAKDLNEPVIGSGFAGVAGGSGVSVVCPGLRSLLLYGLIEADSGVGGVFNEYYRLGLGPSVGGVLRVSRFWRAHATLSFVRYGLGDASSANRLRLAQAWKLPKNFEARLTLERQNHYHEGVVSLMRYF